MAKKKPPEEHENLERWLVSYADFMTLLFATFVVLYALAQSDVTMFKGVEEALKKAFSQNIFDNQTSIMEGSSSIFEGEAGATNPLMLEYVSQKYEQTAFDEIESEIGKLAEAGVTTERDNRGLVITMNSDVVTFAPGTAEIAKHSIEVLDKIAKIIKERFSIHYISVEGHSDSDAISSNKYPTNWELSSARASSVVRFLISNHGFNPQLFSAVGFADTAPVVPNTSAQNKAKNRRVDIVILKNQNRNLVQKDMQKILKEVQEQTKNHATGRNASEAVEGLVGNDKEMLKNVIDMSDQYESEVKRLDSLKKDEYVTDSEKPDFLKQ